MEKQTARLEKWDVYKTISGREGFYGRVFGHPRFPDGTFITTSTVVKLDMNTGIAETLNTIYTLGEPAIDDSI
jgi:hypothetical protein